MSYNNPMFSRPSFVHKIPRVSLKRQFPSFPFRFLFQKRKVLQSEKIFSIHKIMKIEDEKVNVEKKDDETMVKSENTSEETKVKTENTDEEIEVKFEVKIEKTDEETMVNNENTREETMIEIETTDEETIVDIEETRGEVVERLVNDEYKCWKYNTPFLYDLLISHAIDWPSLTVEWLPYRLDSPEGPYSVQKILFGTHTCDNEPNYLTLAQVKLPPLVDIAYDEEYGNLNCEDDRSELVGGVGCKIEVLQQIHHDGEVYRARHMPQNPFIIATKTRSSEVHIFDCRNYPNKPPINGTSNPDLRLTGHRSDGYGLSWSNIKQGFLLSSSYDSRICLWDINQTPVNKAIEAMRTFTIHNGPVEDVAWHWEYASVFASCGADKYLHIYDFRAPWILKSTKRVMAHQSEVSCLSFNPFNEWLVATGSTDKTVKSFDMRMFTSPLHTFNRHDDEVVQIGWSPHNENILASSCAGRRLMVWDTNRIGMGQTSKDAEDGPPELLFIHGGHTNRVPDFSWNPTEDWLIASVADDNMLQVWKMADHIYST